MRRMGGAAPRGARGPSRPARARIANPTTEIRSPPPARGGGEDSTGPALGGSGTRRTPPSRSPRRGTTDPPGPGLPSARPTQVHVSRPKRVLRHETHQDSTNHRGGQEEPPSSFWLLNDFLAEGYTGRPDAVAPNPPRPEARIAEGISLAGPAIESRQRSGRRVKKTPPQLPIQTRVSLKSTPRARFRLLRRRSRKRQ